MSMDVAELALQVDTKGIKKGVDALDKLDQAEDRVGKTAKKSGGLIERSMRGAGRSIDNTKNKTSGLGKGLTALKPLLAGVGFGVAARATSQYIGALAEVSTLVDTSTFDMDALSESVLNQSREFGSMPTENTKAFYQAISAGANTVEKATDAMTAANKLAIGGVTDTLTAVDGLTSAMNAYGGEAGSFTDISDAMFVAVKEGKTNISELSANIGAVAPIAATAGVSLDEVLAATAALTKGGIATSTAMNGLKATMGVIIKPSVEAAKLAEKLGIEFNSAALESKGLSGFLGELGANSKIGKDELSVLFGGMEALTPVLALTGKSASDFGIALDSMAEKTGKTDEAVDKMKATPGFQMNRILGSLTAEFLSLSKGIGDRAVPMLKLIGDSIGPVFEKVRNGLGAVTTVVTQFMNAFNDVQQSPLDDIRFGEIDKGSEALQVFADVVRSGIGVISMLVPHLDTIAIAFVSFKAAGVVSGIVATATAAFTALSAVFSGGVLTGAIGLVSSAFVALKAVVLANPIIAIVTAVGVAAYLIYKNWDDLVVWWNGLWAGLKDTATAFLNWWNSDATFKDVALNVVDDSVEWAKQKTGEFFDWWDNSTLKQHSPEIVNAGMDKAREYALDFFTWWDSYTLAEKATQVKTKAIELAKTAASNFNEWWTGTTYKEKAVALSTANFTIARAGVEGFFDWWDNSTLKQHSPEVVVDSIASAREHALTFFTWWDTNTLQQKVVDVKTTTLETAQTVSTTFLNWWNGVDPNEVKLSVHYGQIEEGVSLTDRLIKTWNESTLKEQSPKVVSDAVDWVLQVWSDFRTWWDKPLKSKVADITFTAVTKAYELVKKLFDKITALKNTWDGLDLKNPVESAANGAKKTLDDLSKTSTNAMVKVGDVFSKGWSAITKKSKAAGAAISEGVGEGLNRADAHVKAASKMTADVDNTMADDWEINSPSRLAFRYGGFVAEGAANGITKNTALAKAATKGLSKAVVEELDEITEGIDAQIKAFKATDKDLDNYRKSQDAIARAAESAGDAIGSENLMLNNSESALVGSEREAERLRLTKMGLNDETVQNTLDGKDFIKYLENEEQTASRVKGELSDLSREHYLHNIEMTQGADAAYAAELALSGYDKGQIAYAASVGKTIEQQRAFGDAIFNSINQADSIKGVFENLGGYLKDWLKSKIALFAKNKIMAFVGVGGDGGGGIGGIVDTIKGLVGGGGSGGSGGGLLSSIGKGISGLFGGGGAAAASSGVGSLSAAVSATSAGTAAATAGAAATGIGGLTASLGGLAAAAGPVGLAIAGVAGGIKLISKVTDTDFKTVVKGFLLGGGVGAALAGVFGGKYKDTGKAGIDVGFQNGEIEGSAFKQQKKKKLFKNKYREVTSELDDGVASQIQDYFDNMSATVVEAASALGVSGADSILDSFSVATQRFEGENAEAQLQAWLEQSTVKAYREATTNLGPQLTSIINQHTGLFTASAEDVAAVFNDIGEAATTVMPLLTQVGLAMGHDMDANVAVAYRLSEALGGTEAAMSALTLYSEEFVPQGEQLARNLQKQKEELALFNVGITGAGNAAVYTREGMYNYVESLEAQHKAGTLNTTQFTEQTAAAMAQLETIIAVEDATIAATAANEEAARVQEEIAAQQLLNFKTVSDASSLLGLNMGNVGPLTIGAANSLVDLMGGLEAFSSATQSYYDNFYTAEEQAQIALATSAASVQGFNQQLELAGASAIHSKDQFKDYVRSLDLTTTTGQQAFAAAMEVQGAFANVGESAMTAGEILVNTPQELMGAALATQEANKVIIEGINATSQATIEAHEKEAVSTAKLIQRANELFDAGAITQEEKQKQIAIAMTEHQNSLLALELAKNKAQVEEAATTAAQVAASADSVATTTEQMSIDVATESAAMSNSAAQNAEIMAMMVESAINGMASNVIQNIGIMSTQVSGDVMNAGAKFMQASTMVMSSSGIANGALSGVANSLLNLSGAAHNFANNSINQAHKLAQAANDSQFAKRGVDGSFAVGTEARIPYNNFKANLHKGEAVLTAIEADQYYKDKNSKSRIGTVKENITSGESQDGNAELIAMLKESNRLLDDIRKDNATNATKTNEVLGNVADGSNRQADAARNTNRINERNRNRRTGT